ncbi:MAG: aldo/keto reductase [Sphingomonadaceae bacterium]|nr:aldo/keto reductase [Sphingomonadaceae bacterium]
MMEMREIGSSGMKTPPLVLGGNVFGWTVAPGAASFAILDAFVDRGGAMIDTADVYSAWIPGNKGGESEAAIGEWLARRGHRDDVLIATKVGMMPGEGGEKLQPTRIAAAADASLARLGTDYIDLYYAHQDDPETPIDEVLGAFDALVNAGKVRHIAASNFTAGRLAEALDASVAKRLPAYCALQPEFNLVSRAKFEGDLQRLCIDRGIGVLPYFGLASGFLTGKYRREADKAKSARGFRMEGYFDARGFAILAAMDTVAAETGATLAQIALAWNAAQPGVTAPIASATSVAQVEELMGALELEMSEGQLARLDGASTG